MEKATLNGDLGPRFVVWRVEVVGVVAVEFVQSVGLDDSPHAHVS